MSSFGALTSKLPTRPENRLSSELARFGLIGEVSAGRLHGLYLKRTLRAVTTELYQLRRASSLGGPKYVIGNGANGRTGYYYRFDDVLTFFGGVEALFHRSDWPELFVSTDPATTVSRPSTRLRAHRTRVP